MFEFIVAGFTGSLLSYLIVFECGGFCVNCANQPLEKIYKELRDINYKIDNRIKYDLKDIIKKELRDINLNKK